MQHRQAEYHLGYEQICDHQRLIREMRVQERLARQTQQITPCPLRQPALPGGWAT
jgi:hypothetical protein